MADLRLVYKKSPEAKEIEVQVPIQLLGIADLDSFPIDRIKKMITGKTDEGDSEDEEATGFFRKRKRKKKTAATSEQVTLATGGMLIAAMIAAAMKS